ncbi:hypothetical protein [Shewanella livingstonensis]|uniref:Uncharacterized protein n=1 Tax=Shewanella livingstonensis TaxID=150120 RepID=A0A3G8LVN6_9GAMM|nr:hypothetical protein [Shewanella livingstonensis]AZG73454.1 hypothetical protein EGC82_12195 [Shewanella livingstonensis]
MFEKNQPANSHQSSITNSTYSLWGNKPSPQIDNAKIDFDKDVTPFVEVEDDVVDENELQQYRQQLANDIQVQLTGAVSPVSTHYETLLVSDETPINANVFQRVLAVVTSSKYTTLIVVFIHVLVISIALIFGRVDFSGMAEVPLSERASKPLPPLKSYLITQAEYDKLVERAQLNTAEQSIEPEDDIPVATDDLSSKSE